jgi:tetraacyldisaccharide 4'-kinase
LSRPVVSIGNVAVGGSGKTPLVAHVARLLVESGYRPAVLSRGYGRRTPSHGTTIVSDGSRILADVDRAGDEPLMLARAVPGVPVLVGASRYASGRLAEERFGATVHLLDDGFQHVQMARDVDLLVVSEDDLKDRPLPIGRLREPLAAAAQADAAIVPAGYPVAVDRVARAVGIATAFQMTRAISAPHTIAAAAEPIVVPPESRVFAVAGIARPERFFADVDAAGWRIVGQLAFRDHHIFTQADVRRITGAARNAAAAIVLTTEKDAVRLERCDLTGLPIAAVPLVVGVEPADAFRAWLLDRLR